ncbi:TPA: class I SAM-dependent methyltransferase [Candidatus Woesearchaeota archaeon]|nr:class I SAM-dependent methyltransferase [Candidatus Woesearchaeota archaeon]HIG92815.1 class I SAM-dependent methyltransferase [Candidatus Woesearchaeota archaeon]HIH13401.1 class I SAM-dependent methyltransferase [Candidatus Woesearchaeota archaeon]
MDLSLICPECKKDCKVFKGTISYSQCCSQCKKNYVMNDGILQFVEDKNTETWDTYWKRTPVYDDIMDVLRKMMNVQLRRYLTKQIPTGSLTLEPGSGSAYVSAMLAEKGFQAYALDYAFMPLSMARKQGNKAQLIQGDLFNTPFMSNTFDLTFNNSTLEHFPNPLDALKEMSRVTKPGKYVFVGVPFTYGPLAAYKLKKSSFKGAWDGTTYDRQGLKKLFQDAGLEVVGSRTFFFRCFVGVLGRKIGAN